MMRFQRASSCWYPTRSRRVSSRRSLSPQAFDAREHVCDGSSNHRSRTCRRRTLMTHTKTHTKEKETRKQEDTYMRAIVYHTYGSPDVLKLEEVQKPVPQDDEVLVQVHAASVNAGDCF